MKSTLMMTPEDRSAVEAEISGFEKRTSCEVVAAIATESGRYDRAESIVGLLFAFCCLILINAHASAASSGEWSGAAGATLAWQLAAVGFGFLAGTVISSYWHGLRRLFVGGDEMSGEVMRAARHVFSERRISSTKERGGILLYVSRFERKVVVLADARVMEAVGQPFCDRLRDSMIEQVRNGRMKDAFSAAIAIAGKDLEAAFSARADDVDELSNTLLIFDPRP